MGRDGDDFGTGFLVLPGQQVDDDVAAHRTVAQCLVASIGNSIQAIAWHAGEDEDRSVPTGVSLPEPIPVHEENWGDHDFDQFSALRVTQKDTDGGKPEYLYFVNMDNGLSLLNNHP